MRMVKSVRVLWTLGIATMGLLPFAGVASANYATDLSTERSGSELIYPKVIWDGSRDTIIRIANTSNSLIGVTCFYVNGAQQSCGETDFSFFLTKQQPLHWVASTGRTYSDAGLSLGRIPPAPLGFTGELKCVQVDFSGDPFRGNAIKGDAVLRRIDGDVSQYNAIAFQGNSDMTTADPRSTGTGDLVYDLTNNTAPGTGDGTGMYSACPDVTLFNHMTEHSTDPISGRLINTELTLVPCREDLENQLSSRVTVQFLIFNEFEQRLSTSTTVGCYMNLTLGQVGALGPNNPFTYNALGTASAYTRITPADGQGAVIGVAEEFRGGAAAAAFNLQTEGNRFDAATNGDGDPRTGVTDHLIIPLPF